MTMRTSQKISDRRAAQQRSSNGSVAVMAAIVLPLIIGMAGLAIDSGNLYMAHSRLQAAVDAAALAASLKLPYDPDLDEGVVQQAASAFLQVNYEEAELRSVAPGTEARSVCVEAEAAVELTLVAVLGFTEETVHAKACAGFNNLEIALVIDHTGSMRGDPINNVKEAAEELVDLVLPDNGAPSTKVGLVPFQGKVRVGENVDGLPAGCRNADGSVNDGLLEEYKDAKYRYPSGSYLRVSSNTCSGMPVVQPLTRDKDTIIAAIGSMNPGVTTSGTVISEGLKWGTRVLTPEAPYTEGSDDEKFRKVLILLTDGDTEDGGCGGRYAVSYTPNNYWTNAFYGMREMEAHCEDDGPLNNHVLAEARAAKAEGIEIFTIRYGSSDSEDIWLMKQVASSNEGTEDHYYDAPSTSDIGEVFKEIGKQLGWRLLN